MMIIRSVYKKGAGMANRLSHYSLNPEYKRYANGLHEALGPGHVTMDLVFYLATRGEA